MRYLLDTCVISKFVAKKPSEKVIGWLSGLDPEAVCLSVITVGEIQKGIERLPSSARKAALAEWLNSTLSTLVFPHRCPSSPQPSSPGLPPFPTGEEGDIAKAR